MVCLLTWNKNCLLESMGGNTVKNSSVFCIFASVCALQMHFQWLHTPPWFIVDAMKRLAEGVPPWSLIGLGFIVAGFRCKECSCALSPMHFNEIFCGIGYALGERVATPSLRQTKEAAQPSMHTHLHTHWVGGGRSLADILSSIVLV